MIILDMRVHGPNDPLCCASQLETQRFALQGDQLIRLPCAVLQRADLPLPTPGPGSLERRD